jgi:hypothetical protein
MAFQYSDPDMHDVGSFKNDEGMNRIAQKGDVFYHFTDRKPRPGDIPPGSLCSQNVPVTIRQATITRENGNVSYKIDFGPPTPASTLDAVAAHLPADMRRKKFIIKKPDCQPTKI